MRTILIAIGFAILAIVTNGIAGWLAGPGGVIFGVAVFVTIVIKFMSYLDLFKIQPLFRRLLNWSMTIAIASILTIWVVNGVNNQTAKMRQPGQLGQVQNPLIRVMATEEPIKVYRLKDIPKEGIDIYKSATVVVVIPLGMWVQTGPEVDMAYYFPDAPGNKNFVIDGPNKNPIIGDGLEYKIFRVRAIDKEGKLKLPYQKKQKRSRV